MQDKPYVLVLHKALEVLRSDLEKSYRVAALYDYVDAEVLLHDLGQDIRAIITFGGHPPEPALLERLPNLGLIAVTGAGIDGMDPAQLNARGIALTSGAGSNAEDVADFAIGLMISAARGICESERMVRGGLWTELTQGVLRRSIRERPVGIIGLGAIGSAIASRLVAFNCPISWWGPRNKADMPFRRSADLQALARECEILFVAAPLTLSTRHLVNADLIDALGPQGLLINVSRGELVDEEEVIAALRAGRLGGAALDVQMEEPTPIHKWAGVPNLILTPHIGGNATASIRTASEMLMENLRCFFAGEPLLTPLRQSP
jgi:lactate dehydrogenase-like 2-hydroxyacid dehydrogenase